MDFKIIGCPEWGAIPPHGGFNSIIWTPKPADEIIIHHTAGHHPEVSLPQNESHLEALMYVRAIQHSHMSPSPTDPSKPWKDSGQNFTVMRNGEIYQGRWRTIRAIQHQRMVVSAHCPGKNDQIGIEHEHAGHEEMTLIQKEASAWLQAWIALNYGKKDPLKANPHSKYVNTSCPVNLVDDIGDMRDRANWLMDHQSV
jgi:hypothetical protein